MRPLFWWAFFIVFLHVLGIVVVGLFFITRGPTWPRIAFSILTPICYAILFNVRVADSEAALLLGPFTPEGGRILKTNTWIPFYVKFMGQYVQTYRFCGEWRDTLPNCPFVLRTKKGDVTFKVKDIGLFLRSGRYQTDLLMAADDVKRCAKEMGLSVVE